LGGKSNKSGGEIDVVDGKLMVCSKYVVNFTEHCIQHTSTRDLHCSRILYTQYSKGRT